VGAVHADTREDPDEDSHQDSLFDTSFWNTHPFPFHHTGPGGVAHAGAPAYAPCPAPDVSRDVQLRSALTELHAVALDGLRAGSGGYFSFDPAEGVK